MVPTIDKIANMNLLKRYECLDDAQHGTVFSRTNITFDPQFDQLDPR
jgi:hypothetical protein